MHYLPRWAFANKYVNDDLPEQQNVPKNQFFITI